MCDFAAIIVKEARHTIRSNLVTLALWRGTYNGRREDTNVLAHHGFELQESKDIILEDNVVAGSERGGYRTDGEKCSVASRWKNNVAHSTMLGINMEKEDCLLDEPDKCSKLSGFTIYRSWVYGVYVQTECSIRLENSVLVDNRIGYFHMSIKPGSLTKMYEYKYSRVENVLFVGQSPSLDCTNDVMTSQDPNTALLRNTVSWWVDDDQQRGRTGMAWPAFASRDNLMPYKPWNNYKDYPAVLGYSPFLSEYIFISHRSRKN